jgi:hypothetical protein
VEAATAIDVEQLRAALDLVLSHVERQTGSSVELTADYYWQVAPSAAYDPNVTPTRDALTLGQLQDDVQAVRDLLDRGDDVVVWHDLQHLAGVLQRIATQDLPGG